MIQPGQKLKEGDYTRVKSVDESITLEKFYHGRYVPNDVPVYFKEGFGLSITYRNSNKCRSFYNFADFKQLCENTFGDGTN